MAVQQAYPWNKNRIIGQKKPLQISHIWGIRIRLELEGKARDLALFNLALDSKLRGCDLVKLKVSDISRLDREARLRPFAVQHSFNAKTQAISYL